MVVCAVVVMECLVHRFNDYVVGSMVGWLVEFCVLLFGRIHHYPVANTKLTTQESSSIRFPDSSSPSLYFLIGTAKH